MIRKICASSSPPPPASAAAVSAWHHFLRSRRDSQPHTIRLMVLPSRAVIAKHSSSMLCFELYISPTDSSTVMPWHMTVPLLLVASLASSCDENQDTIMPRLGSGCRRSSNHLFWKAGLRQSPAVRARGGKGRRRSRGAARVKILQDEADGSAHQALTRKAGTMVAIMTMLAGCHLASTYLVVACRVLPRTRTRLP